MLFHPSHPGEVLKDYLGSMTVKEAAKRLGVTRPNLSRILNGRAGISAAMSVRLAKAMPHTSPEFWLKMQTNCDLWKARKIGCQESDLSRSRRKRSLPQPEAAALPSKISN
ncbi:MAG: HigA family addiction module antitoxin [Terriglobales bacterium]